MRTVAIHQPNFFPWLGFFDKLATCDAFIVLDHVQLPGASGSWVNRVRALVSGEARWITAPVQRRQLAQTINATLFDEKSCWRQKIIRTLQASYGKAAHYQEAMSLLEPLVTQKESNVAEYNFRAILEVSQALGLDTSKIRRSSSMNPEGTSTALLIDLTLKADGNAYLRGAGGSAYQDDVLMESAGIVPRVQAFAHPIYVQHRTDGGFVEGLSVIDALMNLGISATAALLEPKAFR